MNERREKLFREVINRRQPDLAVVLENVHDPHNIGAVLRSCESVGILDVYLIQTEIPNLNAFKLGRKSSGGARKYIDLHVYNDLEEAVQLIKSRYKRLVGTHLGERASDLYDLNLVEPVAIMFGNEHNGLSSQAAALCDGHFHIPMLGFTGSLNVSVACAITVYEALRQRRAAQRYATPQLPENERIRLFERYAEQADYRKGLMTTEDV